VSGSLLFPDVCVPESGDRKFRFDKARYLANTEIIDIATVPHQQLIEAKISPAEILLYGNDKLYDVDRFEFEVPHHSRLRVKVVVYAPLLDETAQKRDDATLYDVLLYARPHYTQPTCNFI
jgi:hypothetical protein